MLSFKCGVSSMTLQIGKNYIYFQSLCNIEQKLTEDISKNLGS